MDQLDAALRKLPREVKPARDLWPDIAAGLRTPVAAVPLPRWRQPRWLATAAAIVFVALGLWMWRSPVGPASQTTPYATADAMANLLPPSYLGERERLLRGFEADVAALPPESRAEVEEGLATVQRALEDVGTALQADAASPLLRDLFIGTCQDEMRLLLAVQEAATQQRGV